MTGALTVNAVRSGGVIQSDVTSGVNVFRSEPSTAVASFTLTSLTNFSAGGVTIGAGSAVTSQIGFFASSTLSGAGINYGFRGDLGTSALTRFNFAALGSAPNFFVGNTGIGATSATMLASGPQAMLHVGTTAGTARIYNSFTDASNGEWAYLGNWSSNVAQYGTGKNGTGVARAVSIFGGDALALHITTAANVVLGSTLTGALGIGATRLGIHGVDYGSSAFAQTRWGTTNAGPFYALGRSRGTTIGDYTAVASDDLLGSVTFLGTDGDSFAGAATITARATGTISDGVVPGLLDFNTATAAGVITRAMRIGPNQLIAIGPNATLTPSFPALKRSTTTLQVRDGADSAYATLDALSILDSGTAPTGTAGSGYVRKTSPTLGGTVTLPGGSTFGTAGYSDLAGYTTVSTRPYTFQPNVSFSTTSSLFMILFTPTVTPTGASASIIGGVQGIPSLGTYSGAVTAFQGYRLGSSISAGYSGTISSAATMVLTSVTNSGSNPAGNTETLSVSGATTNGNGITSGAVTNNGASFTGSTAAAGAGGTVNNRTIIVTLPTGSDAAGTTVNVGLRITGNGGASATNYTVYSDSTARSYHAGQISVGTTIDPGAGNLLISGTIKAGGYTVATLPTVGTAGRRTYATDVNATLTAGIGAVVAGGGANVVPVFDDGTNWRIG
jgi:hypothetical protein